MHLSPQLQLRFLLLISRQKVEAAVVLAAPVLVEGRPVLLLARQVPQRVQQQALPPAQRRAQRPALLQELETAPPLLVLLPVQPRVRPLLTGAEMALARAGQPRLRAARAQAVVQLRRHLLVLPTLPHPPDLVPMAMAARHPRPKVRKPQRLLRVDATAWIVCSAP